MTNTDPRQETHLKAYSAYLINPEHGAILIFANSVKEAKRMAFPVLRGWDEFACWTSMRVRQIKNPHAVMSLRISNDPHIIESPPTCKRCEQWGGVITGDMCSFCIDNDESEEK